MTKQKVDVYLFFFLFWLFVGEEKEPKKLPYAKGSFLSPSEMSFYKV